jgi:hypothetical protein
VPFAEADERLRMALEAATAFCQAAHLDYWGQWFAEAAVLRHSPEPAIPYHPDLLPAERYTAEARRLLACACKAWVFGGMGTWNDLVFEEASLEERCDRLTPELFEAVVTAIASAANEGRA